MMMMKKITLCQRVFFILLICFSAVKSSYAQFENTETGARAIGLNGAFTSLSDNSLAIFYNPGGLGQIQHREISAFYSPSAFGLSELSSATISYAEPLPFGTAGLGIKTFGFDLYRELNAALSFGKSFNEKIFVGVNLNLYHLAIQNYNSATAFGIDAGAIAQLTGFLKWGFFAKNVSGTKIGISEQKLPQVYRTGFTISPNNELNFVADAEKDVRYPLSVRAGMEYMLNQYLDIRAGVGSQPSVFSGGVGFKYKMIRVEYAVSKHFDLGMSNHFSVTVRFQ